MNDTTVPNAPEKPFKKHECIYCPMEVRGLFAQAFNACNAYENRNFQPERCERKMAELRAYIEEIQPGLDRHFEESTS